MIEPPNDRIDCSAQAQSINEWVKASGRAERVHIDFLRKSARTVVDVDNPDQASNLLECLKEFKPNYGAWSTQYKYRNRAWSQNYTHYNEEGKGKDHQRSSRRTTAQGHSREDKSAQSEVKSKVPEPSGVPSPPKARPSQSQGLQAEAAPPGFGQLHKLHPLETHGIPSSELSWLRNTVKYLKDLSLQFWTKLNSARKG